MVPVDNDKIDVLTSEFLKARRRLGRLAEISAGDFLADEDKMGSAKYNFVVAIEAAIDMSNHAIAKLGLPRPEDYADSFRVLGEAGAFREDFTPRLVVMAKFRNRLVHFYHKISDETVHQILRDHLSDLDVFLEDYHRFVGR